MTWTVVLSRQAVKAARQLSRAGLKPQAEKLLRILAENPFQNPPRFEKLLGNLAGFYSWRRCYSPRDDRNAEALPNPAA